MDNLITINNENLANYVMFKLNKIYNSFTHEEIDKINELVIDCQEEMDVPSLFKELLKFRNLKKLTIRNGYIYNYVYNILLNLKLLKELNFENCEFDKESLMIALNIYELSLVNCKITDYSFVSCFLDILKLDVINGTIKLSNINTLKKLNYLNLSYSHINLDDTLFLDNITHLYIDNTNIKKLDFINNLPNLKELRIDESQYNNNLELIASIKEKKILVLNEFMIEYPGVNHGE